jgi:hypothetical protein
MDVDVEIREATVWRMPTRESSKVRYLVILWALMMTDLMGIGLDV